MLFLLVKQHKNIAFKSYKCAVFWVLVRLHNEIRLNWETQITGPVLSPLKTQILIRSLQIMIFYKFEQKFIGFCCINFLN